jgi:hypothetical protein
MSHQYVPVKRADENADYLPVQWILLAVIAGIVALCVGGFTIWHIMYPPLSLLIQACV